MWCWCGGWIGPVGNGSVSGIPGTGAPWRWFRLADRGAGPDHASRASDGWLAGNIRRVRKRDPAGTNSGWLAHARQNGKRLGRPATAVRHAPEIRKLHRVGVSKSEIARRGQIGRTSVRGASWEQSHEETPRETLSGRTVSTMKPSRTPTGRKSRSWAGIATSMTRSDSLFRPSASRPR